MSQKLTHVRRVSVVDEIVEQMTRRIIGGEWPSGTVLPSLRTLTAEFGVSMLTVREGIRTLQAKGLVETRHGIGSFVVGVEEGSQIAAWMLGGSDVDEYLDLIEARQVIESAIIAFAVERRTDAQLARLDVIVQQMHSARLDSRAFLEADAEYHVALAEAAHNRVLLRSILAIRGPMKRFMANRNLQHLAKFGDLDGPIADHETIVEALRNRDADHSTAALEHIIDRGRDHLQHIKTYGV